MWLQTRALIKDVRRVSPDTIRMDVQTPEITTRALPGQFVHILCGDLTGPFLRRPISIHTMDKQSGKMGLLFRVVGTGTRYLASLREGETIDLMGPLGNGWPSIVTGKVILVAGGIGVAPMPEAASAYIRAGLDVVFLLGARTASELLAVDELCSRDIPHQIATDDGSVGHHGFVTDLLKERLRTAGTQANTTVLACGPAPMLVKVKEVCRDAHVKCFVSLEQRMGCGVGACLGCSVKTTLPSPRYLKVCTDGPVFDAETVVIESV